MAVVWSILILIRLRLRILCKHDLKTVEVCCANDRFISNMTPRLRAESTGASMTLLGRWMVGLLSLESCCGRPKMRNSVLEGLRDRTLEDIQLDMLVIVFSWWVLLWEKSRAENDKRSWVSSAKIPYTLVGWKPVSSLSAPGFEPRTSCTQWVNIRRSV